MVFALTASLTHDSLCRGGHLCRAALWRECQFSMYRIVINDHCLTVADLAFEQAAAQCRLDLLLDDPLERPGAVGRIVADAHHVLLRCLRDLQPDVPLLQPLP